MDTPTFFEVTGMLNNRKKEKGLTGRADIGTNKRAVYDVPVLSPYPDNIKHATSLARPVDMVVI